MKDDLRGNGTFTQILRVITCAAFLISYGWPGTSLAEPVTLIDVVESVPARSVEDFVQAQERALGAVSDRQSITADTELVLGDKVPVPGENPPPGATELIFPEGAVFIYNQRKDTGKLKLSDGTVKNYEDVSIAVESVTTCPANAPQAPCMAVMSMIAIKEGYEAFGKYEVIEVDDTWHKRSVIWIIGKPTGVTDVSTVDSPSVDSADLLLAEKRRKSDECENSDSPDCV